MFFAPFAPFFDPRLGRPSTPMEVYLRLMFLKFRYRLGYETLCREVADSITWRRFCRIPIDGRVPHPTTLMKLTTRCGTAAVDGLQRGAAGQGGAGEAAAHDPAARRHHGRPGRCGLPDRLRAAGQGGAPDRRGRTTDPGRRRSDPNQGAGPQPLRRARGPGRSGRSCGCAPRRPATRPRPWCAGSPASWPGWPNAPRRRRRQLLVNARRALRRAQAKAAELAAAGVRTRPPDGAAGGCAAP